MSAAEHFDALGDSETVNNAQEAYAILDVADCSGTCESMLKAQLLAAKFNALVFADFDEAMVDGQIIGDIIVAADQALADQDTGAYAELAGLLDAANTGGAVVDFCSV